MLVCHTETAQFFTKDKEYEIVSEGEYAYVVIDNTGEDHFLTKNPDEDGHSYKTFMTLKEDI
jgi:hypothetical protein